MASSFSRSADSLASQNVRERGLSPELAEKDAHELQRSFESAACGDDGGNENDEDGGGGGGGDDDDDGNEDGNDEDGVLPVVASDGNGQDAIAMDIETPGLSALVTPQPQPDVFADAPHLKHTASSAKAWVSATLTASLRELMCLLCCLPGRSMQVDNYISCARRKGGRQTEKSVLSLWRVSSLL